MLLLLTVCCLLFAVSCRQDMQDQPKMKAFRSSTFFGDGLSARQPVQGTVPRGFLREDVEFFTGKKRNATVSTLGQTGQPQPAGPQPGSANAASYPDVIDYFPMPIDEKVLARGKERYEIFCSVCHGLTGYGDGMVVRRGFRRAASYHDDRLRQAPVGHFFDVMTNGWGVMPSYAPQIPAEDRWAIIAYIRALQLSQQSKTAATTQTGQSQTSPTPTPSGGHQ